MSCLSIASEREAENQKVSMESRVPMPRQDFRMESEAREASL